MTTINEARRAIQLSSGIKLVVRDDSSGIVIQEPGEAGVPIAEIPAHEVGPFIGWLVAMHSEMETFRYD